MASLATKAKTGAPIVTQCLHSQKVGVVVSAGKMSRAVKVRVAGQEWNKKFRKVRLSLAIIFLPQTGGYSYHS